LPAVVITASPVLHLPCLFLIATQASNIADPPARCMAPSTPPPPNKEELAALTIASAVIFVISPLISSILLMIIFFRNTLPLQYRLTNLFLAHKYYGRHSTSWH